MTIAEAQTILNETRAFITEIQSDRVVLLGPFKPLELEAVLVLMRNQPMPPNARASGVGQYMDTDVIESPLPRRRGILSVASPTETLLARVVATLRRGKRK